MSLGCQPMFLTYSAMASIQLRGNLARGSHAIISDVVWGTAKASVILSISVEAILNLGQLCEMTP